LNTHQTLLREELNLSILPVMLAGYHFPPPRGEYSTAKKPDPLQDYIGEVFVWLRDKWYVDEIYDALILRPYNRFSEFLAGSVDGQFWHDWFHDRAIRDTFLKITDILANPIDKLVIDGAVNGAGRLVDCSYAVTNGQELAVEIVWRSSPRNSR
jgi:NADH:ubiquinone oxidoreductase subunit 5 (subunit L)/multisubunit Na+/H+ antiporter MnhA subunit